MSHGVCGVCDQLAEAVHRQFEQATASARIDRTGWTDDQWIDDAERLMNEPDGAITSLVNGHVMALLRRVRGIVPPNIKVRGLSDDPASVVLHPGCECGEI